MAYIAMARKWRPNSFQDMVGQEHIAKTIENAITGGRLHHAFLFTGTRGVGKTTSARILARTLNCTGGNPLHPCGECRAARTSQAETPWMLLKLTPLAIQALTTSVIFWNRRIHPHDREIQSFCHR
jgi:DNA polymerase-3 subunit gamma/tau